MTTDMVRAFVTTLQCLGGEGIRETQNTHDMISIPNTG